MVGWANASVFLGPAPGTTVRQYTSSTSTKLFIRAPMDGSSGHWCFKYLDVVAEQIVNRAGDEPEERAMRTLPLADILYNEIGTIWAHVSPWFQTPIQ